MSGIDPTTFFDDCQEGRLIELTKGYWAIVDEEDYERISQFSWQARPREGCVYATRNVLVKEAKIIPTISMQCEVMKSQLLIDHINCNGLDNRKRNLRYCTTSQNAANNRKTNKPKSSRYKGVSRKIVYGRLCWRAEIKKDQKLKHLGYFDNEEDAALVYDREARILFGEFARTNFDTDDGRTVTKGSGRKKLNDDQIDKVIDMISIGIQYIEISNILGVSKNFVKSVESDKKIQQRNM